MEKELDKNYILGNEAFVSEKYMDAINFYTQSLSSKSSRDPDVLLSRSHAFIKAEKYVEAKKDAEEAIALKPMDVKGRLRSGIASFHLGAYQDAKEAFSQGLRLDPNDSGLKQWTHWSDEKVKKVGGGPSSSSQQSQEIPQVVKKEKEAAPKSPKDVPAPPEPQVTHGWYQTASSVVVEVRIKNLSGEDLKIEFKPTSIKTMPKNASSFSNESNEDSLPDGILLNDDAILIKGTEHALFSTENKSNQPYWDCFRLIGPPRSLAEPPPPSHQSPSSAIGSYCNLCHKVICCFSSQLRYADLYEHLCEVHQDFLNGSVRNKKQQEECLLPSRMSIDVVNLPSTCGGGDNNLASTIPESTINPEDITPDEILLIDKDTILLRGRRHHLFCNPIVREQLYWEFVRFIGPEKHFTLRPGDKFTSSDAIGMFCLHCKKIIKYTKGNSNNIRRHMHKFHYDHLSTEESQIGYSSVLHPESSKEEFIPINYEGYLLSEDTVLYKNKEHYLYPNPLVRERLYWDFVRLVGPEKPSPNAEQPRPELSSSDALAMLCIPCNTFMKFVKGNSNILRRHMNRFHRDYLNDNNHQAEEAHEGGEEDQASSYDHPPSKISKLCWEVEELEDVPFSQDGGDGSSNPIIGIGGGGEDLSSEEVILLSEDSILYKNKEHLLFINPKVRERHYWDFIRLVGPEKKESVVYSEENEPRLSSSDALAMYCIPCKKVMKFIKGNSNTIRRHMKRYHQNHIDRHKEDNTKDDKGFWEKTKSWSFADKEDIDAE